MSGWRLAILKNGSDESASSGEVGRVAVDVGERPLAWFKGYVDDPVKSGEKFSADGRWYLTGDLGCRSEMLGLRRRPAVDITSLCNLISVVAVATDSGRRVRIAFNRAM